MVVLISALVLLVLILLVSNVKITSAMLINQYEQSLTLSIHLYGIQVIKRDINLGEDYKKEWSWKEAVNLLHMITDNFGEQVKRYGNAAVILLKPVVFRKFEWKTHFGTGEAASTGTLAGGIWTAKGTINGLISERCTLSCIPSLEVNPLFNQRLIQSQLDCIVTMRIGKAIYAFIKTMRLLSVEKQAFI